ncbi:Uncharacterised protein [Vibrio cholerae]|nr:Uncharacterised protein [Vibrio cholerae]
MHIFDSFNQLSFFQRAFMVFDIAVTGRLQNFHRRGVKSFKKEDLNSVFFQ